MVGYSDTVSTLFLTVTLFQIPNGVTAVSNMFCIQFAAVFNNVCHVGPEMEVESLCANPGLVS